MFGRKRIEELERKVNLLNELLEKETENRQQLGRIVRYAKDNEPTFNTHVKRVLNEWDMWEDEFWIYLYINKEEYYIHLKDFDNSFIYPFDKYFDLEVRDGLAYLTYEESRTNNPVYHFVIDYKRRTYVLRQEEKKKEEPKCTDC